jgi:hypothetical protein
MNCCSCRRARRLALLLLIIALFAFAGAVAADADSTAVRTWNESVQRLRPDTAPTATPPISVTDTPDVGDIAEPAIMDDKPVQPSATLPSASPTRLPKVSIPIPSNPNPAPSSTNLIVNGGFEDGFVEGIAIGWQRFATGGVQAGWQDDTWEKVVYEGSHAQLLSLKDARDLDRYVGVFQTVTVAPDADYLLTLHGLIRSDEGSAAASNYGYRLQYGVDPSGGADWQSPGITWVELPWDEQPRATPPASGGYPIDVYTTTIKSHSPRLTLFIRGWKKWIGAAEGDFDVDGISLMPMQLSSSPQATRESPVITPVPPPAGAESGPAAPVPTPLSRMPQTGTGTQPAGNGNQLTLTSVLFVVLLISGVVWKLSRHQL